ncbi:MAG: hypothetical protein QNK36_02895 [Colwellia sp.]|nr:hypothetical protein [Colwellia sp.]
MYLFRATNCIYFTRVCSQKNLKNKDFTFCFLISLLTKVRSVATKRNLVISLAILELFERINDTTRPDSFKVALNQRINALGDDFLCKYI